MIFNFLINPSKFNKFANIIFKPLCIISILILGVGLFLVYNSPLDYQQGLTVKIMYIHVPAAWLALLTYAIMTVYSIVGLAFKIPFSFIINKAIAPIGAVFTLLCLISGSLWGKPMWGTYWVWDARITSTFILLIQYIGLLALRTSFNTMQTTDQILSIVAIVGAINIPIIKFSVNWWNTLHQNASITFSGSSIDAEMLYVLPLMLISFGFIAFSIFGRNMQSEIIIRQGPSKKNRRIN